MLEKNIVWPCEDLIKFKLSEEIYFQAHVVITHQKETRAGLEETFTGLEACTNYGIAVSAVTISNAVSDEVSETFKTQEDKPSAPQGLQHSSVTKNSVQLLWFVPSVSYSVLPVYE